MGFCWFLISSRASKGDQQSASYKYRSDKPSIVRRRGSMPRQWGGSGAKLRFRREGTHRKQKGICGWNQWSGMGFGGSHVSGWWWRWVQTLRTRIWANYWDWEGVLSASPSPLLLRASSSLIFFFFFLFNIYISSCLLGEEELSFGWVKKNRIAEEETSWRVEEKKNIWWKKSERKKNIKKYFEWDMCPKIYKIKITI